jgi:hypothetical protein
MDENAKINFILENAAGFENIQASINHVSGIETDKSLVDCLRMVQTCQQMHIEHADDYLKLYHKIKNVDIIPIDTRYTHATEIFAAAIRILSADAVFGTFPKSYMSSILISTSGLLSIPSYVQMNIVADLMDRCPRDKVRNMLDVGEKMIEDILKS